MIDEAPSGQEIDAQPTGPSLSKTVVLTDHPWEDLDIEREIMAAAGLTLVVGPAVAVDRNAVEMLVRQNNPVAIMTCWAEVSDLAVSLPDTLKIVARLGVGLDNIAVDAATARGAWVSNVPDYCVGEVSDHAIALLLAHYRGIVRLDGQVKKFGWASSGDGLERISDLTVGIIGFGRIGRETARKLHAFGCRVLAHSLSGIGNCDHVEAATMAVIQREADVILLHAPLTPKTMGMIDDAFFAGCKRAPLLINVSRGGLVSNEALMTALASGRIRGAALDVIDGEPKPPQALIARPDVIVTPHVAYASAASMRELRRRACEEVVRAVSGQPLEHPCNVPAEVATLDGGVASDIRVVDGPSGKAVIKKALTKLRVSADWFSDPSRSATEVAAIDTWAALLGPDVVPEILWVKPEENCFAMRMVDSRLRNWKKDLLSGTVDARTARRAGQILGEMHQKASGDDAIRQAFGDTAFFNELRVEPFFHRTADRNPDLGPLIRAAAAEMDARKSTLVHGDFSPKNILADGGDVVVLDFEVAHWGDPSFDIAFCTSHLLLKSMRKGADTHAFNGLISAFLAAYRQDGPEICERGVVELTACLMLARLDGASPVDYLADLDPEAVRALAQVMLTRPDRSIETFLLSHSEQ